MSHTNSTTNYALPQFLSSDKPAWMADINVAFSDIDAQMKVNEDAASAANTDNGTLSLNFAAGYSNSSTYDVGDVVVYNKRMYICDIAVTVPEAFDSGKWSYYRVSDTADAVANVSAAENALESVVGSDDISGVGTSCTDAILNLNAKSSGIDDTSIKNTNTPNYLTVAPPNGTPASGRNWYYKKGSKVCVSIAIQGAQTQWTSNIASMPAGYRPYNSLVFGTTEGIVQFDADGSVYATPQGNNNNVIVYAEYDAFN